MNPHIEFQRRASRIPFLGMGLSVDVYSPDLPELMAKLDQRGLSCSYLEIFKASHGALQKVRSLFPSMVLNYHAEGLWVSQPDWETAYPFQEELDTTADHLGVLGSFWLNQECASKQMVGYSFGTYLPPLFTKTSAAVTATNADSLQVKLDERMRNCHDGSPLLLLETPPLTYFGFGDLSYPEYFGFLTESCSCGLVLDIGHVWTVFRYSGAWRHRSLEEYLEQFLNIFPLERVVQIHLAGLDCHPTHNSEKIRVQPGLTNHTNPANPIPPPDWVDVHGAPIPEVLWDMLDRVLKSPRLVNLKGIALEVDTKSIELIVEEFDRFQQRFEWWVDDQSSREKTSVEPGLENVHKAKAETLKEPHSLQELVCEYKQYVDAVTGRETPTQKSFEENEEESENQLEKYVYEYLPHEVLVWGGDIKIMFPHTIQRLEAQGFDLSAFVRRWYSYPRSVQEPYDFFLVKIDYFMDFVKRTCPSLSEMVSEEARGLREGYLLANNL